MNIGVVLVDEGMIAAEIPVVKWAHVVALIGDVAVQRRHRMQVGRTHDFSSLRHKPLLTRGRTGAIVHRTVHYSSTLDRTFFALSDGTRRRILERLAGGPATIGELARPFGLTLNGVKKHVSVLEEVDLVVTAKVGRARECQLGPAHLQDAASWIDAYGREWHERLDRFAAHVEQQAAGTR
ncbi:MAG: ArsR/SmtB family transcription factor [Solirubrobacteraceae bacterium]